MIQIHTSPDFIFPEVGFSDNGVYKILQMALTTSFLVGKLNKCYGNNLRNKCL